MVREDLIEGAVTFLQDPSVASAPIEQRLSFLRSKNLTQEEIDASLARAGQATTTPQPQPPSYPTQQYRQLPPQQYGYQQPPPYWNTPPPEPPHRDWRDWFIMATVASGVSYAAYWTAKRYIYPLIAPPTPPQLEQDKAHIDASFDKTFALLEQLATDTQELKDAETARKERLDRALAEVESVVGRMKEANEGREAEAKRWGREMEELKEQIPQAMAREKEAMEGKLRDLTGEMKSLKTLVANRMGQQAGKGSFGPQSAGVNGVGAAGLQETNGVAAAAPVTSSAATPAATTSAVNGGAVADESENSTTAPPPASVLPDRSASASPYSSKLLGGKAQIPSWQLAAKKRSEDAKKEAATNGVSSQDVSQSGTVAPAPEVEAGA